MRRALGVVLLLCVGCGLAFGHHVKEAKSKTMPLTTSSPKARDLYERAMADYENLYLERANIGWRAAVEADPDCALAQAWIAFNSRNPVEATAAREKAKSLLPKITPGERLMIEWITNVQAGNFLAGIAAMNDMMAMFPKDKRVFYLAGNWLLLENDNERAVKLFDRALDLDKNYPAALNDLAYAYARDREFAKAFEIMDRYTAVLPKEPNPQDSYGELLRMSGDFEAALEHYRASLKIDPDFTSSQVGLADTYALMGDQARARVEYDKAIQAAHNDADRLDYNLQKAMTWVREGNFVEADKAYAAVAESAHRQGIILEESQAYRFMSMYQPEDAVALKYLTSAEDALLHASQVAASDREEERSRVLRCRALRAVHNGDQQLADKTLHEIESMAGSSRSMVIQASYHGAAGAVLVAREKFSEAIPHLEEDLDNPCSLELLVRAYGETGSVDKMHEISARLGGTNVPTIEQTTVVTAFRAKRPTNP